MSNLANTPDCISYMMFRSGGRQATDDFRDQALLYLNLAHRKLIAGATELDPSNIDTWIWARARRPKTITIKPMINAGTASVQNGSQNVTLSTGQSAGSLVDHFFKVENHDDVFRVITHNSDQALILDSEYTGQTQVAAEYKLIPLEYTVGSSDILRIIAPMRAYQGREFRIMGASMDQIERSYPLKWLRSGTPSRFAIVQEDEGTITVRFNKFLREDQVRVDFDYIPIPDELTDSSESVPKVPLIFRTVLCDFALFLLYSDKNDDRAIESLQFAQNGYKAMRAHNTEQMTSTTDDFARPIATRRSRVPRITSGYGWE